MSSVTSPEAEKLSRRTNWTRSFTSSRSSARLPHSSAEIFIMRIPWCRGLRSLRCATYSSTTISGWTSGTSRRPWNAICPASSAPSRGSLEKTERYCDMLSQRLIFRVHAIRRMFQRRISDKEVRHVIETGETIETYPEDSLYPSRLVLGWYGSRPLHVVVADNVMDQETIVITVYEPNQDQWEEGFRRRRQ
jgi:hypothetical protein